MEFASNVMNTPRTKGSRFFLYIRERFPVVTAFLYSLLFTLVVKKYLGNPVFTNTIPSLIVLVSMFLFLFRLRLLDEIKDFEYDSAFHTDRPMQRGLLSQDDIKKLIVVVLGIEIIMQFFNSVPGRLWYVVTLVYSLLIYKDFFARKFFKKNLSLELVIHEPIFVTYGFYAFATLSSTFFVPRSMRDLAFIGFILATPFIFELGRKMVHRTDLQGNITNDTYAYHWGEKTTFYVVLSVMTLQAIAFMLLMPSIYWVILFVGILGMIVLSHLWGSTQAQRSGKYWSLLYTLLLMIIFSMK